jgi:hypothetical protein
MAGAATGAEFTIKVKGYTQINRAFKHVDKTVNRQWRALLVAAAEPVKRRAEQLAASEIRNVKEGDPWGQMRVGVTTRVVYVAPKRRGSKGSGPQKRPEFGPLLMDRAMEPALEENTLETMALLEVALDRILEASF